MTFHMDPPVLNWGPNLSEPPWQVQPLLFGPTRKPTQIYMSFSYVTMGGKYMLYL